MNIGIVGTAGSGKSAFAFGLQSLLLDKQTVSVIDHYIDDFEQASNMALDGLSSYVANLYVALGRYAREREAREHAQVVITCGTLIETSIYSVMSFMAQREVLNDEEAQALIPKMDTTLRMMACLYTDIFKYDHLFYLPATRDDNVTKEFDRQLQAAVHGFKLAPATALIEPDQDERLQHALQVLNESSA